MWDVDRAVAFPRSHKRGTLPATDDKARRVLIEILVDRVTVARGGRGDDRLRLKWRRML